MKISIIPPWVKALALVALVSAIFGFGRMTGIDSATAACEQAKVAQMEADRLAIEQLQKDLATERERLSAVSGALQTALMGARGHTDVITREIAVEIEKPVYRDCVLPASGVQLLSEAATRYNAARPGKN